MFQMNAELQNLKAHTGQHTAPSISYLGVHVGPSHPQSCHGGVHVGASETAKRNTSHLQHRYPMRACRL